MSRLLLITLLFLLAGCRNGEPPTTERYEKSDALFTQLESNVASAGLLSKTIEIDHSRMGAKAGSFMPPARVLIFSNPQLETDLIEKNQLISLDLPLRVLAYEVEPGGDSKVVFNSFAYIQSRYKLDSVMDLEKAYDETMALALQGIETDKIASFEQESMQPAGITTIDSPFDFQTTIKKVQTAIDSQDDTVNFGSVDFKAQALQSDVELRPTTLLLFGAPAPGAKAMSSSPTLGLDAFCQKFLIWEDEEQKVHLSFNDLLSLAERQNVDSSVTLRVINSRLNKTFEEALSEKP